jgi:phosphate transport system protein
MDSVRMMDREMENMKEMVLKMGLMVQELIILSVDALKEKNRAKAEEVISKDEKVDQLELQINENCIRLVALRQPEASDLRFIMAAMRIANDLERIGDLSEDIAERAIELMAEPLLKPLIDIPKMAKITEEAVAQVIDAFVKRNAENAKAVWDKEKEVDHLRDLIQAELTEIMKKDANTVMRALPLLLISRHLERICDHATNIGEEVVYMVEGKVVKHSGGS